jgi:DNA-binding Lrp family transcriptional regulator
VKNVELRLVAELMKNCRRSDRELAKVLGISQPTVSRTIKKLEKNGIIESYTILPNFGKLGYTIMAITFSKTKGTITPEQREKAKKYAAQVFKEGPFEIVMGERGMGMDFDGTFISYHKDYSSYMKTMNWFRQLDFLDFDKTESFLINLHDEVRYRPLNFKTLGKHLLTMNAKEKT